MMQTKEQSSLAKTNIGHTKLMGEGEKGTKKAWEKMDVFVTVQAIWIATKEFMEALDLTTPFTEGSTRFERTHEMSDYEMHPPLDCSLTRFGSATHEVNDLEMDINFDPCRQKPLGIGLTAVLHHNRNPVKFTRLGKGQNPVDSIPDTIVISREYEVGFGPFSDMHSEARKETGEETLAKEEYSRIFLLRKDDPVPSDLDTFPLEPKRFGAGTTEGILANHPVGAHDPVTGHITVPILTHRCPDGP
jgi:hypothetical protein